MFTFSPTPQIAEEQVKAILLYLTAIGHSDGDFSPDEVDFIRSLIADLAKWRAEVECGDRKDSVEHFSHRYRQLFSRIFDDIRHHVRDLMLTPVGQGETVQQYALNKLVLRCFEVFQKFDEASRQQLFDLAEQFILADGVSHPAERALHEQLLNLLNVGNPYADRPPPRPRPEPPPPVKPVAPTPREPEPDRVERVNEGLTDADLAVFAKLETHYSRDHAIRERQLEMDRRLIHNAMVVLEDLGKKGRGKLRGIQSVKDLDSRFPYLDRYIHVIPPSKDKDYELIILGDLHGCYSCLKAAVIQSGFIPKVRAYQRDPAHHPEVKLILLGDYIDRGRFSFNGVMRLALYLQQLWPEHVCLLRGNHEFLIERKGKIISAVYPAEAYASLAEWAPNSHFGLLRQLFDALPNALLFDRIIFVHGGLPRDDTLRENWIDLSSLNHKSIRFQMLWSDPSDADFVPSEFQGSNTRFPFGRSQFLNFMNLLGTNTMVRGHEKVANGFEPFYAEGAQLFTLFSAGGRNNADLPENSDYREVEPKGITLDYRNSKISIRPWPIHYHRYQNAESNRFYQSEEEIPFLQG